MDPITVLQTVSAAGEITVICLKACQKLYDFAGEVKTIDATLARIEDEVTDLDRVLKVITTVLEDSAVKRAARSKACQDILAGANTSVERSKYVLGRLDTTLKIVIGDSNDSSKVKALRQAVRMKRQQKSLNEYLAQIEKSKQTLNVVITTLSVFMVANSPQYRHGGTESDIAPLTDKLETVLQTSKQVEDSRIRRTAASVLERARSPPPQGEGISRSTTLLDDSASEEVVQSDDGSSTSDLQDPMRKWLDLIESSAKASKSGNQRASVAKHLPPSPSDSDTDDAATLMEEPQNEKFQISLVRRCIEKGNTNYHSSNHEQAAAQLEEALRTAGTLSKAALVFLERDLIKVRLNIAAIYTVQEKRLDAAEEHLLQAVIAINEDKRGIDHDEQSQQQLYTAYYTLAKVYMLEGKYEEAQSYCEDAVNGHMSVAGNPSKHYYDSLQMLVRVYHAQGNNVRAQLLMEDLPPELREKTKRTVAAGTLSVPTQTSHGLQPQAATSSRRPRHGNTPSLNGGPPEPLKRISSSGSTDRPPSEYRIDPVLSGSVSSSSRDSNGEASILAQNGFTGDFDVDKALAWAITHDQQRIVNVLITPPGLPIQRKRPFGPPKQIFKLANINGSSRKDMRVMKPLLLATTIPGRVMMAKLLLESGANKHIRDEGNRSLLEVAAIHGQQEIISVLLDHGLTIHSPEGTRAFLLAAQHGHVNVLALFLNKGIKPDVFDKENGYGRTAINLAAQKGQEQVADFLIKMGADQNIADRGGSTPLMASIRERHQGMMHLLLRLFADVNLVNDRGQTALIIAAEQGQVNAAKAILEESSVRVDTRDNNGWTALIWACNRRQLDIAQLILEHGSANVNAQCYRGSRALDHAKGSRPLTDLLRQYNAQPGTGVKSRGTIDDTYKGYVLI